MKKEMLINAKQSEECRIAVVEDSVLEELYVERVSQDNFTGNIYKGKIVNCEPSIQAVFVDFGVGRNGFLHISDVEPQYFRQGGFDPDRPIEEQNGRGRRSSSENADGEGEQGGDDEKSDRPQKGRGRSPRPGARPRVKPPIEKVFRLGDEVLVQVIKEGIGNKGPTLSTYISIPGRYLVLMPALGRVGVSRKIEDEDLRRKLRGTLLELNPPKGVGFIIRTAGIDRTKKELSRDLAYLVRLWKVMVHRLKTDVAPVGIYEESDMIIRTIRDIFTSDVDAIHIDDAQAFERAKEFLQIVMPRYVNRLQLYDGHEPLYHKYKLDEEIRKIQQREVKLRGGGSIVIDSTEALVAIDVNSGSFRSRDGAEEAAFQLNMTAAKEIARQLRLRDLGGVVVNDFIDMRKESHRRSVERELRDGVKRDRAKTKILRTSPFGLIEMTRQRIRPSLKRNVYSDCPCCGGNGLVKTPESVAIEAVRGLSLAGQHDNAQRIEVSVAPEVAEYMMNKKRREITRLEEERSVIIEIHGTQHAMPEFLQVKCTDAEGREIKVEGLDTL
jgi:ribonuclease E